MEKQFLILFFQSGSYSGKQLEDHKQETLEIFRIQFL